MQKIFSFLIIPFLFFGHPQSKLTIENGRPANSIQIKSDYDFIEAIYEKFSKEPPIPLIVVIDYDHNQGGIGRTFLYSIKIDKPTNCKIITENSRGIWFHEILHYFVHQLPSEASKEEFLLVVISNLINGVTADDFRKKYSIVKGFKYESKYEPNR